MMGPRRRRTVGTGRDRDMRHMAQTGQDRIKDSCVCVSHGGWWHGLHAYTNYHSFCLSLLSFLLRYPPTTLIPLPPTCLLLLLPVYTSAKMPPHAFSLFTACCCLPAFLLPPPLPHNTSYLHNYHLLPPIPTIKLPSCCAGKDLLLFLRQHMLWTDMPAL